MKTERHSKIVQLVKKKGFMKVTALADYFNVTPETIRSDLNFLSKNGLLKRSHGGAMIELNDLDALAQDEIIKCLSNKSWIFDNEQGFELMNSKVCVMGSFNVDMFAYLPRMPQPGESLLTTQFIFSAGGKGNNQAIASSKAGAWTHFITKVGTDQFSNYAIDFISSSDIKSSGIYQSDTDQTGTALIFVDEVSGENVIAITPGANMAISQKEVRLQKDRIVDSNIILLQLETNIDALQEIIAIAKDNEIPVIVNPAPYNPVIHDIIDGLHYITPNQTEAELISGVSIVDIETAKKAAKTIHQKGVGTVIITMGVLGSVAFDGLNYIHTPVFPAAVKNTTGAGDAFNGSLAASLSRGDSLKYSLKYASAFSSLAVETNNASDMPEDSIVKDRINKYNLEQVTC
ncbi:PfkB family carbohydrate kinase [Citrobacter portucalensis]|uniref:PfkB family carbohydrate kinase n=1 Tax=Citrobacter portucalensis TaxID=1639133 RepID=UPI00226B896D|nr:PfkB family carbohydrate kinase [Citrobacter portucalensis]MCX8990495.1 PfkB family carbohydrate kinase [Citrobacter portucalensis]